MEKIKSFQQLEDIATAGWQSEILYLSVEKGVFDLIKTPLPLGDLATALGYDFPILRRFLRALEELGLVVVDGGMARNTEAAAKYLLRDAPDYQGHSILWRKKLGAAWRDLDHAFLSGGRVVFPQDESEAAVEARFRAYSFAMDDIARCKADEIVALCPGLKEKQRILDLGSGLGAISRGFLKARETATAVFCDMSEVLFLCREVLPEEICQRIRFCSLNILESWESLAGETFDLVVMSNILHAFDAADNRVLLGKVAEHLSDEGVVLIHDFYYDHVPKKAALTDLNMLINTYNGRVYSFRETKALLQENGIPYTKEIPLASDTALILGAKNRDALEGV